MAINSVDIHLNAFANFSPVFAEVAKLKASMAEMQSSSFGSTLSSDYVAGLQKAQQNFTNLVQTTRAFNIQSVQMADNVSAFSRQLEAGQLKLGQYYSIWKQSARGVSQELDSLATQQARVARSVVIPDALHAGYAQVITDLNGTVSATEKATFYQTAYNTVLRDGANKLIDFGKNMQWAGRQLTVGLTVPMALFATQAAHAYLSFDKAMTDMLKVYGSQAVVQSQQALDTIRTEVTNLATDLAHTIGVTMTDTVTIAQTFSQMGLTGQNLIETTKATAGLMKLGGLTAADSAQAAIAMQNVFKLQSSQMTDAINFLNAAKHSTSTSMQDIVDALPRVGPIITQMGGSYKDFATLLVALRENGVPASQAANTIKSMFATLVNPTTKAINEFNNLGISLKGIVSQDANNPLKMLEDLKAALDKLPSAERTKAIEELFGKFQFARADALISSLGAAGSQNEKVMQLYSDSSSQLAAVAKQELDIASSGTPAAQYAKMKASLQADLIPIGREFLVVMTKIGGAFDHIVQFIDKLGPLKNILVSGLGFAAIVGPIVMLTGLFANFTGTIFKGLNYLRMFKVGFMEATDASPMERFGAALRNMSNFYKEVDVSALAASHSTDLMQLSAENSIKAFDVLAVAIRNLTIEIAELNSIAVSPAGLAGSLGTTVTEAGIAAKTASEALHVPLPVFSAGGGISVVPGPENVNYDSVMGSVPVGGFVLNKKASQNLLRGYSSGGHIAAMLTPGELVFDPSVAGPHKSTLEALNNGYAIGGLVKPSKLNYGILNPSLFEAGFLENIMQVETQELRRFTQEQVDDAIKNAVKSAYPTNWKKVTKTAGRMPYIDPNTGYTIGSARSMNEAQGIHYPADSYDRFGIFKAIQNGKQIEISGYSSKPSVGLFGYNDVSSTLSAKNSKMAISSAGLQSANEIDQFIKDSVSAGQRYFNPNNTLVYGSPNLFLSEIMKEFPGMVTPEQAFNIPRQIDARLRQLVESYKANGISLTDANNTYALIAHDVFNEYSSSNPRLVAAYTSFENAPSAYNAIRPMDPSGSSGEQNVVFTFEGKIVNLGKFKGAKNPDGSGSLFYHSSPTAVNPLMPIQARATGGPVNNGKPYLVGERGPELFVPGQSGNIIPHFDSGGPIRDVSKFTGDVPGLNIMAQPMEMIDSMVTQVQTGLKMAAESIANASLPFIGSLQAFGANVMGAGVQAASDINMANTELAASAPNYAENFKPLSGVPYGSNELGPNWLPSGALNNEITAENSMFNQSALERAKGRFNAFKGEHGMGMRMGGSMALTMAAPMLGNMIGGTAGSAVSSIGSLAGMGLMFGPEGAAVGAAIGGIKTIFDYMDKRSAQTAAEWKSSTTLSASDQQIFGKVVFDTSLQTKNLTTQTGQSAKAAKEAAVEMAGLTTQFGALAPSVASMITAIKNLPKGDPLGDLVKDISDPTYKRSGVVGNLEKSLQTGIATGTIDPTQAKQYIYSALAAAGRTSDFGSMWSEIKKTIGYNDKTQSADTSITTAASLNKIKNDAGGLTFQRGTRSGTVNLNYSELDKGTQAYADQMLKLYAITSKGNVNFAELQNRLNGVKKSGDDTGAAMHALELSILNSGNTDDIKRLHDVEGYIKGMGPNAKLSASEIMKMNAVLQVMTPDQLQAWANANGKKLGLAVGAKMGAIIDAYAKSGDFKKTVDDANKALLDSLNSAGGTTGGDTGGTTGGTGPDYTKIYNPIIKQYEGIKKLIDAQAAAQKKYNDELKATQDYQTKQMDYFNQAKTALTSGNYLGAAQAQQSALQNQADFRATQQQQKQSDLAQNVADKIALLQDAESSGTPLAQFLKDNKGFKTTISSKYASDLLGGLSKSDYAKITSMYTQQALYEQAQGAKMASGGAFSSITINVSADNSVVPDAFAQKVAAQVLAAHNKAAAKSLTSHNPTKGGATRSNTVGMKKKP